MHDAAAPTDPRSFVAFAPYGVGVMCALFYLERGRDIYGWWMGARDSEYESAYFKLEDYFTRKPAQFYATQGADLYGGWRYVYSAKHPALDKRVPMDDDVALLRHGARCATFLPVPAKSECVPRALRGNTRMCSYALHAARFCHGLIGSFLIRVKHLNA